MSHRRIYCLLYTSEISQIAGEVSINPNLHYQTLDGWGTSLCWWGNVVGSWGDKDFNGNGIPDREEIAELAFSPEYLNLNIVRYNVGGGDKENTSMKRVEGIVPGWTVDMTGTSDGTLSLIHIYSRPFPVTVHRLPDTIIRTDPVSYTHLDVYKRQSMHQPV